MGDRRNTAPRSTAQNTRVIRREQMNMSDGVYNDIPASKVPQTGLYDLKNAIALPWGVQGRTGSKLVSLELPAFLGDNNGASRFTASQSGTTVTWLTGTCLSTHARKYMWWPDGTHDVIVAYLSANSMRVATSATRASTAGCRIRDEMNALLWHSKARLLLLHLGSSLYWSTYPPYKSAENLSVTFSGTTGTIVSGVALTSDDARRVLVPSTGTERIYIKSVTNSTTFVVEAVPSAASYTNMRISSWVPIYCNAKRCPSDAKSTLREWGDDAVLFTSNGINLLRLSEEYPSYCLLNDEQPKHKQDDDAPSTYGRKVTMTFSTIEGSGLRDRTTGSRLMLESANTSNRSTVASLSGMTAQTAILNDFWESWAATAMGTTPRDYRLIRTALGEIGYHWTHFSLYGTLDIGVNGIDAQSKEANNSERFYWMDDVPRIKCFLGTITADTLVSNIPIFSKYDVGVVFAGVAGTITITAFLSANTVTVTHTETGFTNVVCAIGSTRKGTIGVTGATTKSKLGISAGFSVSAADVGKLIWFSDGSVDIITAAGSVYGAWTLEWIRGRDTSGGTLGFAIQDTHSTSTAAYRYYRDLIPDNGAEGLRVRDGFLLSNRFMEPLPPGNVGAVCPGFIIAGSENGRVLCYSNTGDRRFAGYFHPTFQVDSVDIGILRLSEFEHCLIGYGRIGYALWDLTDTKIVNDELSDSTLAPLGRNPIVVFRSRKDVKGIGCLSVGAVCKTRDGIDLVVTQNKEIRIFDGYKFGDNLLASRYQRKFDTLQAQIATHFDKRSGFLVFGTKAALME
jgi:hypothetical protein